MKQKKSIGLSVAEIAFSLLSTSFAQAFLRKTLENEKAASDATRSLSAAEQTVATQYPEEISPVGVDEFGNTLPENTSQRPGPLSTSEESSAYWPDHRESEEPRSIIGLDARYRITDTRAYPNRAIVHITRNGEEHCSGWMVSKDTLVTAGHCLYSYSKKHWYSGLLFSPGADRGKRPFGSAYAKQKWTDSTYIKTGNQLQDWGIVKLNRPIGNSTGWFGLKWQSASYGTVWATVRGYPGDKPLGEIWSMSGHIQQSKPNQLCYPVDTARGQSGSPVYLSGSNKVIAIHAYGTGTSLGRQCPSKHNAGTRITKSLYELIMRYK